MRAECPWELVQELSLPAFGMCKATPGGSFVVGRSYGEDRACTLAQLDLGSLRRFTIMPVHPQWTYEIAWVQTSQDVPQQVMCAVNGCNGIVSLVNGQPHTRVWAWNAFHVLARMPRPSP